MIANYDYGLEKYGEGDLRVFVRNLNNIFVYFKSSKNQVYFIAEIGSNLRNFKEAKKILNVV